MSTEINKKYKKEQKMNNIVSCPYCSKKIDSSVYRLWEHEERFECDNCAGVFEAKRIIEIKYKIIKIKSPTVPITIEDCPGQMLLFNS